MNINIINAANKHHAASSVSFPCFHKGKINRFATNNSFHNQNFS